MGDSEQPILLMFIDSFPYDHLPEMPFLSQFHKWRVSCGVGYSVNIKAELFAGMTPDDLGYFNEWQYDGASRFRRHSWWLRLLEPARKSYFVDRMLHRFLLRAVFRQSVLNIPYRYLGYFSRRGFPPYSEKFEYPSLFTQSQHLRMALYSDISPGFNRDTLVAQMAREIILREDYRSVFVAWADLDSFTHRVGVGSKEHLERLRQLDSLVYTTVKTFQSRNPDSISILISDHGMSNVDKVVALDVEQLFGPADENRYLYFIDSNMIRFWLFEPEIADLVDNFFRCWNEGCILTPEERITYGVSSRLFGDIIVILDEGSVFAESFWGRGVPAAMHGYHPNVSSQKGFVAATSLLFQMGDEPSSIAVYKCLKELLCGS